MNRFVKFWKLFAGFGILSFAGFLMTSTFMPLHLITTIFTLSTVFNMGSATFFLLISGEE